MLVITKGYLIKRQDYGDFDEIITFINEHGIIFNCFSAGSRKITSKNARNLDYGNYCEFEFFHATNEKLSRLKKVTTISYLNNDNRLSFSLMLISDYLYKCKEGNKRLFELYQKVILFLLNDINDYLIMLYICIKFYSILGTTINFKRCVYCGSMRNIKTINLTKYGGVCKICYKNNENIYDLEILKLWFEIQNNNDFIFSKEEYIDITKLRIVIRNIMNFIYENHGIYTDLLKEI